MSEIVSFEDVDVHVEGKRAETIVMVHGWPDTYRLWDAQVNALTGQYRCIRFTLPGFSAAKPRRAYTIDELVGFLERLIGRFCPEQKVILLLHDWGCVFGYEFAMRKPQLVSKIIGVDIGDPSSLRRTMTRKEAMAVCAYQVWLALAWMVGGTIGDWMARAMARWARCPSDQRYMSSCMNYPYFLLWFGGRHSYRHHTQRFAPTCPMLFIYGSRKPFMFHAKAWIDELLTRKANQVVKFDTGHWVMSAQPEQFNRVVVSWLSQ